MSAPQSSTLRIGVYLLGIVQYLDVAPVDILACFSHAYLEDTPMPQPVKDLAIDVKIKYISPSGPSASNYTSPTTAQTELKVDYSITSPEAQPGAFDIIFVPGPPPSKTYTEAELDFIRKHWNNGRGATIMSVCTGIYSVAAAGVCAGRKATGPRGLMDELKTKYPAAKWEDKRWTKDDDGKLWTSGGVTNGNDMVAAWCREHYPGPLCELVLALADVGDRGQKYGEGKAKNTIWWMVMLLGAWLTSGKKAKAA